MMICLPFPLAVKGRMGEHGPSQSGLLFFWQSPHVAQVRGAIRGRPASTRP
jgi:hypothetical protein